MTWNTQPQADPISIASLGAVSVSTWYQVDQRSLLTGGGTYTIRFASTSANGVDYSTRRGPPDLLLCSSSASVPKGDNSMTRPPGLDRHAPDDGR